MREKSTMRFRNWITQVGINGQISVQLDQKNIFSHRYCGEKISSDTRTQRFTEGHHRVNEKSHAIRATSRSCSPMLLHDTRANDKRAVPVQEFEERSEKSWSRDVSDEQRSR